MPGRWQLLWPVRWPWLRSKVYLLENSPRKAGVRIIYGHAQPHRGCFGNLSEALAPHGIAPDQIPICFNIFMHVTVDGATGRVGVLPPKSRAGDYVVLEAKMALLVGMTACSAEMSNNYAFKPIQYEVLG